MGAFYKELYERTHGRTPSEELAFTESDADVFGEGRGFMQGFDLTLQLAVGCPAGCLFCYVPGGGRLTPQAVADNWGYEVRHKKRAIEKFRRRLSAGGLADKTLYWSGVTDPYALGSAYTRPIWEALLEASPTLRPRRIAVQSRFLVSRDAELIGEYIKTTATTDGNPAVVVSLSIGTDRDDLVRAIERATPLFGQRLRCVQTLRECGVPVVVTLSPCLIWADMTQHLTAFHALGVSYLTVLFLKEGTRFANTPPNFLYVVRQSEELRVVLDEGWRQEQLGTMRAVFGEERVIEGQLGFATLSTGHRLIEMKSYAPSTT